MKEFIEKLIGRLEELYDRNDKMKKKAYEERDWENFELFMHGNEGVKETIEIVNQLAEEYNNESVKTNADYIRNMTNDELATFLSSIDHITDEGDRIVVFEGEAMHDNIVDIEIWLKEKREPKGE